MNRILSKSGMGYGFKIKSSPCRSQSKSFTRSLSLFERENSIFTKCLVEPFKTISECESRKADFSFFLQCNNKTRDCKYKCIYLNFKRIGVLVC